MRGRGLTGAGSGTGAIESSSTAGPGGGARARRAWIARVLLGATGVGIRRRPVEFIGLAVLTGGAVLVAVVAPLLLRAAQQYSLSTATPTSSTAVVLIYGTNTPPEPDLGQGIVLPSSLWRTQRAVTTTVADLAWRQVEADDEGDHRSARGHLLSSYRCAGMRITDGHCPVGTDQTAVSAASGVPLGSHIELTSLGVRPLTVVGRFEPSSASPLVNPLMAAAARTVDRTPRTNDLVVDVTAIQQLPDSEWFSVVAVGLAHPLRLEDLPAVHEGIARAHATLGRIANGVVRAPIESVVAAQQTTADAAALLSLAIVVQTLAVAWAAQALFIGGVARARAREWGIARLRGFPFGRRLVSLFTEPLVAIVLGAVVGYVLATLAAQTVASAATGTRVQPLQPLPLVVGAFAVLGSLVALVLASVRSATLPLAQLLRERTESRRIGRFALVAQSGAVLATALVVYSVLTGGRVTGPQLPLLAPSLVAATIGILALRVALPLLRRRLSPVPTSLTGLLVGRRVIRTPSLLATALVLCTAVALATAALQTVLTSNRLQLYRAQAVVGATRVLDVRAPVGADLVAAVRRADPSGRLAMAAVDLDSGAGPERVVAVDTARLAAVSAWHVAWSGMSAERLHRLLAPDTGPSLQITGRRLDVGLANTSIPPPEGGPSLVGLADLQLSLTVQNESGFQKLVLGRLTAQHFTRALPCAAGCRVVGFSVVDLGADQPWSVNLGIASLRTDAESATRTDALLTPKLWRQQIGTDTALDDPPTIGIAQGRPGLALKATTSVSAADVEIVPRDTPQPVPVLAGPQVTLSKVVGVPGAYLGSGLGFEYILVRPVGRAQILPRALGDGVLTDLTLMQKVTNPADSFGRSQVWLSDRAGPSVIAALQREGLRVIGDQRLKAVETGYLGLTVPQVALQGAAVGCAGLVLALLSLLASRLLRRPSDRATARVLRAVGASRRTARRIAFTEAAAPAGVGALLGAAAGAIGALLILPGLPLGAGEGFLPPLDVSILPAAVLIPLVTAVLLSLLIAAVTSIGGRR